MRAPASCPRTEAGIVLVTSLLLLVVITILALSMFRSFGIEEKIAGNSREKHRALQAAESAQQYAEWWLTNADNVNLVGVCNGTLNANTGGGMVCSNPLPLVVANNDVTTVPWSVGGAEAGVIYTPPSFNVSNAAGTTAGVMNYAAAPRFYISLLGPSATGSGNIYQIDAWGYGGTQNAVAVVESTYLVDTGVKDLGGL
jgi:type IV pilus assembly protein PilX